MHPFAFRLLPGQDLKSEIVRFVSAQYINAGFVMTCVGSLQSARLRMANETICDFKGPFEIVSLVGTLSADGVHLHISLSDKEGRVVGGHVKEGCIVYTTAEVVIGNIERMTFSRVHDLHTKFKDLVVLEKK